LAGGDAPLVINPYADARSPSGAYAGRMGPMLPEPESQQSAMLRLISLSACTIIVVFVTIADIDGMLGKTAPVVASSAVALAVAVTGLAWVVVIGSETTARTMTVLTAVGLAGALQVGLLPEEAGYLIIFVALIGIGMELPLLPALTAGFVVFAAANVSFLVAARLPLSNIVSNDVGAAFLFTVGLFIRSARASQARARADQARAEGLLAELRASQAARAEAAALTERTRLAREIHDILAHSLTGLVLALDTAELLARRGDADPDAPGADIGATGADPGAVPGAVPGAPRASGADTGTVALMLGQVNRAQRIAREGLADTRRAISALRGDELPGPALLDRLVRETSEATGSHAELTVAGEPRPLAPEVGLALYRTAQEALINTAKYAGRGGRAALSLSYRTDGIELEIEDAPAPDAAPHRSGGPNSGALASGGLASGARTSGGLTFGGYGLTGMRERAELLGGTLTAGPTDQGFQVLLWLPTGSPAHQVPREAEAG
jgi:signal transduction histidine kinase